ncbi:MAG: hypothetical protein BWX66_01539 [Deltaproteobacteria bacterium ADurb.Bin058]|nr:MAG: hypothetical protein BWX66_01539 [Deltaproteobacteria bacterium ADurb.Bin058]
MLLSSHSTTSPTHFPSTHLSFIVQKLLSLQASPSSTGTCLQTPSSQESTEHSSPSSQSMGWPTHIPSMHLSFRVQAFPSSQVRVSSTKNWSVAIAVMQILQGFSGSRSPSWKHSPSIKHHPGASSWVQSSSATQLSIVQSRPSSHPATRVPSQIKSSLHLSSIVHGSWSSHASPTTHTGSSSRSGKSGETSSPATSSRPALSGLSSSVTCIVSFPPPPTSLASNSSIAVPPQPITNSPAMNTGQSFPI